MSVVIRSSAAEIIADPQRLLDDMRARRVITLSNLNYTIAPSDLVALSDEETDDEAGDMVSLTKRRTGIDNTIFASTKGCVDSRHGPRIKIALDPPKRLIAGGKSASMSIGDYSVRGGYIPPALVEQAKQFIERNRAALPACWEGEIETEDFIARLEPI